MSGLNLAVGGIRVNANAALRKKSRKFSEGGVVSNPVPANRPGPVAPKKAIVGSYSRDPIPSISAEEFYNIKPFRCNTGFCADPVPARSV